MDGIDYVCWIVKENVIGQTSVKMKHFNSLDFLAYRTKKMLLEILLFSVVHNLEVPSEILGTAQSAEFSWIYAWIHIIS